MLLGFVLFVLFAWRRLGHALQRFITTKRPSDRQLAKALRVGEESAGEDGEQSGRPPHRLPALLEQRAAAGNGRLRSRLRGSVHVGEVGNVKDAEIAQRVFQSKEDNGTGMARDIIIQALTEAMAEAKAAGELPQEAEATAELQAPRDPKHGDFSTSVALAIGSALRRPRPRSGGDYPAPSEDAGRSLQS